MTTPTWLELSWEEKHLDRKSWTSHVFSEVQGHMSVLDKAADIETFWPEYSKESSEVRAAIWSELISALAYYESGWDPCSRYKEETMGIDPVTNEPVFSEGLLQLSYQDVTAYPGLDLPFDWNADRALARSDCSKSILDPYKNLTGGISILSSQITKSLTIVEKHPYWSTLGDPSVWKHSKVDKIAAMVRRLRSVRA